MLDTGFMDLNPNVVKTPAYCVRLQSLDKNITTLAANFFTSQAAVRYKNGELFFYYALYHNLVNTI